MFIPIRPTGVNVPRSEDRMPLWQVVNGDEWTLTTRLYTPSAGITPVTPDNSRIVFTISEDRFSPTPIWTGRWLDGILLVDQVNHPGLVVIRVPDSVTASLRRGVYSFSITVADSFGRHTTTALAGTLQVEYEPTSPTHDIPYRS